MDAKFQELERQALAENDGLLGYKLFLEAQRLNLFDNKRNRPSSFWKIPDSEIEVQIESDTFISVSHLGYSLALITASQEPPYEWVPIGGSAPYALGQHISKTVSDLIAQNIEEFDKRCRERKMNIINNAIVANLRREATIAEKLQNLRKEIGLNYLDLRRVASKPTSFAE